MKVLFFGQLRDLVGRSEESLEAPEGSTLGSLFNAFAARHPSLEPMRSSIVLARNREFAKASALIEENDEIAFLPPVSGGTGPYTHLTETDNGNLYALTRQTIDTATLRTKLLAGTDGAIVVFEGVVRNNTKGRATKYLDYECYEAMAIKVMAQIGQEIAAEYAIGRLAMVHRLGRMEIGEASVVIVATAPHRRPAFDAALEGINRLKRTVPIWKKEHFEDGEIWVDGEWDESVQRLQSTS